MRLILIRHGETDLNRRGRFQGLDKVSLNPKGRAQAHDLSAVLPYDMPFVMYSSPLPRSLETSNIISEEILVDYTVISQLQELNIGELSGLNGEETRTLFPGLMEQWSKDPASVRFPKGESLKELQERVWEVVLDLYSNHCDETVVAVSHNFAILAIVSKVVGIGLNNIRSLSLDLCGITRMELTKDKYCLTSFNETMHLRKILPGDWSEKGTNFRKTS